MIGHHFLGKTDIAAMFSGEEFVILLLAREVKSGFEMAEKMRINVELLGVQYGQPNVVNELKEL
ncbi:MAG: hypothetical protein RPS47_10025 [Colwellia sp.]